MLAAGAPRYQHVGRVLLFNKTKDTNSWSQIQKIDGHQVSLEVPLQTRAGRMRGASWAAIMPQQVL